jgi:protein O-mannosyl-transferase
MPKESGLRPALGILACALTALVYQTTLDHPFVFDDRITVLLNPSLVDLSDLRGILLYNLGHPVVNVSYAIDSAFSGISSFGFHVTNRVLHLLVVGLFYGWCTRAFGDQGSETHGPEWPAFFAAGTFALHPVIGATTAYISARSELLCAAGFLAALIFGRRAILRSSRIDATAAIGCGAVAVASSSAGAALPIVMLAYDGWVLRTPGWRRRVWRVYAPALAAVAAVGAWRIHAALQLDRVPSRNLLENLMTESIVIWRYVGLLVVPAGQSIVHDVRWITSPADPWALLALTAIAAAVAGALWLRRAAPLAAIGLIWFFAALAPSSSLIPLRDAMAEPRLYVAGAGLIFAVAAVLAPLLAKRRVARVIATAALATLALVTIARNRVWSDPLALGTEAVQRAPDSWRSHFELAELLKEDGQCDRAEQEYSAAVRLNPGLPPQPRDVWRPSCSHSPVQR